MKRILLTLTAFAAVLANAAPVPDAGARAVLAKYAEKGKNYAPRTGRTAIFARSQLKYGPQRNDYLHRWTDRPLMQDTSLQKFNDGNFINPAVWKVLHGAVRDYGIDGFAFFPGTKNRPYLFTVSGTPGYTMTILPEFIKNFTVEKNIPIVDEMIKCPQVYRFNGKFVITTYSGTDDPEYWVNLKKALTAKYGDIFLFLPMHNLPRNLIGNNKTTITAAEVEELAEIIRKWLRCVDGYYYNYPALDINRYFDLAFTENVMIPLLNGILSEDEFKNKLLAWGTKVGHENFYVKGSYTYNCGGTSMLRGTVGSAVKAKADVVNLVEWDEENENTHFRPTLANGFSTRRIIRYFAGVAQGKLLPPLPGDDVSVPDVILSYRRVLVAGENLDMEIVNVPCPGNAKAEMLPVTLTLKDLSGKTIRTFNGKLDNQKLDELRFNVKVADILDSHLLIPELKIGDRTFADGFTPIELRANYNGDNKWFKHPIRDLAKCSTTLQVTPLDNGKVRVDGKISSEEPLNQVTVLDSGAEIWIDNDDPRFRETSDRVVIKITAFAKPRVNIKFDGKIRILGAKNLQCGAWHPKEPKYLIQQPDGWDLTGVFPSSMNSRKMVFSFDRASLDTAEIDVNLGLTSPKFSTRLFDGRIKVKDIVKKRIFAVAGEGMSHIIFEHNNYPVSIPESSGKKEVEFSIITSPSLPQSVYFIEAIDKKFRTYRSIPVTIFKPSGKKAEFSAFDFADKKAVRVSCDAALLTPIKFFISPEFGAVMKNSGGNQLTGLAGGLASIANHMRFYAEGGYGNIAIYYMRKLDDNHNGAAETVLKENGKYVWKFNGKQNVAFPPNTIYPYSGFELTVKCAPVKVNGTRTLLSCSHAGFRLVLKKGVPMAEFYRANAAVRPVVKAMGHTKLKSGETAEIKVRFDQKTMQIFTNGVPGTAIPCSGHQLYPQALSVGMDADGRGFVGEISELSLRPL